MTLQQYLNSLTTEQQAIFARASSTSIGYLRKVCSTGKPLGAQICSLVEMASNGQVTRQDLRPDDWHLIWPELAQKEEVA